VQQTRIQQGFHHDRYAADLVHVVHHEPAERLEVAQVRDLLADPGEVVHGQLDPGLVGDRQQVQYGVGRATEGHHHGDRVLERFAGHDLAGGDALLEHGDHGLAAAMGETVAPPIYSRRSSRTGDRHAEGFGSAGHRVGGVHAAAGALTRADRALDPVHLVAADQAAHTGTDGLEGVDDRDVLAVHLAGHDRTGVEKDRSKIKTGGRHQHAGQRLVTPRQQDRAVQAFGLHHGLHRVGDDLPADQ